VIVKVAHVRQPNLGEQEFVDDSGRDFHTAQRRGQLAGGSEEEMSLPTTSNSGRVNFPLH
jgi:hypothetical protein